MYDTWLDFEIFELKWMHSNLCVYACLCVYTLTQDTFNNHTVRSLYRILLLETSVMGVMKMGNIVLRAGIECTSLAFWANVLTITPHRLPDVTTTPVYAAPCLGQLIQFHIYRIYVFRSQYIDYF